MAADTSLIFPYPGTLLLGGGGSDEISSDFDREFSQRLPEFEAKILYIPIAWSTDITTYSGCLEWFNQMVRACGIRRAQVVMATTLFDSCVEEIDSYDAIFIGGGNTYNLLAAINSANFGQKIKRALTRGKTVFGSSAGAIVMGRSIRSVSEENSIGPKAHEDGLSLLGDLSIRCHYTSANNHLIGEFTAYVPDSPLVAIPESAGLIACNGKIEVAGAGHITVFRKNLPSVFFKPGDALKL